MSAIQGSAHSAVSPLDHRRQELTARLRSARSILSPTAAVEAAGGSSAQVQAAADLATAARHAPTHDGFQPRSMTMRLIMQRPDVTLRVVLAIATLVFGARMSRRFDSIAAVIRALRQTLETVSGRPAIR